MKLELFIFDVLQFADRVHAYYAERDEEVCRWRQLARLGVTGPLAVISSPMTAKGFLGSERKSRATGSFWSSISSCRG
jgi:hypothetical protein